MNDKQSLEVFSTMSVPKAILKNAGPAIVAMLMVLVYNLADVFFVGQTHDPMQVSAITLASQAFWSCQEWFSPKTQGFDPMAADGCYAAW